MVLFTYTDYLRCKKQLDKSLILQEDSVPYPSLLSHCNHVVYHNQHKLYQNLLNNKKEFFLFLEDFFGYHLSLDVIKYNRNFITKDYSNTCSDVIFKLKTIPAYVLIEHQSYPNYSIPYRIYKYYSSILEDNINSKRTATKSNFVPFVTPIILYTGNPPWNFIPNFQDHPSNYTYNEKLQHGKLSLSYNFINIHNFSKEELLNMHSMIAFAMAIDKCKQVPELIDTLSTVYNLCSTEQKDYLYRMLVYLLKPIILDKLYQDLLKKFNCEEETYMEELIQRMRKDLEDRQKTAETEGIIKGIDKRNVEIARKLLKRNMIVEDIADITGLTIQQINALKIV